MTILPMGSEDRSASLRFAEHRGVSENAGEVGGGPDEVTGAVPIASHPLQTKTMPALRANIVAKQATLYWLNLRLRRFHDSGPQEDSPETGEPGTEKVDRSRTTLRNLLTMFIVLRIAPLSSVLIGKRSGSQATNRDSCQPPLCFTIAHIHSLAMQ
jgi:hypothetical protein